MDKQRAQSRSSPKTAGNRHGARAAPPRRRGHRRGVGRHAGERGSGQATRSYLGAPSPTTNRLAKHQLIADVEVAEVVYSAQGRLAAAPEGRRLEDTSLLPLEPGRVGGNMRPAGRAWFGRRAEARRRRRRRDLLRVGNGAERRARQTPSRWQREGRKVGRRRQCGAGRRVGGDGGVHRVRRAAKQAPRAVRPRVARGSA